MKIQTSMLVSQMAGSLNGSSVRRSRYGLVLQKKASGLQSNTNSLGVRRSIFASIAFAWNLLDPIDKEQWQLYSNDNPQTDRFGNPIILSGYNYFIKIQNFLHTANFSFVNTPNYENRVDTITSLSVSQIAPDTFQASADLTGNDYPQTAVFFCGSCSDWFGFAFFELQTIRYCSSCQQSDHFGRCCHKNNTTPKPRAMVHRLLHCCKRWRYFSDCFG